MTGDKRRLRHCWLRLKRHDFDPAWHVIPGVGDFADCRRCGVTRQVGCYSPISPEQERIRRLERRVTELEERAVDA